MAKASPVQNNFNAGELSSLVQGRTDVDILNAGLNTCLNIIPVVQGPAPRRSGTKYVAEVKDSLKTTLLVRFEFSTTQAYIMEFGDLYCRIYRNQGQVVESNTTIEAATKANPIVVTDTAHGHSNGDRVVITGVVGMVELNNREFIISNKNTNDYELQDVLGVNIDSSTYTTYTSDGSANKIFEFVTPYKEADLFQLKFVQSADVLYVSHPDYAPRKISRTGHTTWTLTTINFLDGPYLDLNITAITITPNATSGTGKTLTASAALWASTDVNRLVRIKHSSTWGYAKITAFTSDTVVTVDIKNNFGATTASVNWRLGIWSDTTSYPAAITFFENRLVYGGATNVPQRLDGSKNGDYENFAPTATDGVIADDNAISFTLNAKSINVIIWLADDDKGLLIGTVGAEWLMRPSALGEALSPTNVNAKISSRHGSKNIEPVQLDNTFFVQNKGRKLRNIEYSWEKDKMLADDTTTFAEHITKGGIIQIAKVTDPTPIVWGIRSDGILLSLIFDKQHEVEGWARQQIGGVFSSGIAQVKSVATIPANDSTRDETWLIVKRTIDGRTVQYIEYINKIFEVGDDQDDQFFVDSGLIHDGASVTTLSGLWHLNGESLEVLGDGAEQPNVTVSNGSVTITTVASKISIGEGYNSDGESMRWEAGAVDGTAIGKTRRINRVGFLLINTGTLRYGPDFDNLDQVSFRLASDNTAEATPLFTGIKSLDWPGDYDFEGRVAWRASGPLSCTIAAIAPQGKTEDRG